MQRKSVSESQLSREQQAIENSITSVCMPRVHVTRRPVAFLLSTINDAFCKLFGAFC
jgi:hypothetical protein